VAATNQLSALLDMHWPGAKTIFADVESPIALTWRLGSMFARQAYRARSSRARIGRGCSEPTPLERGSVAGESARSRPVTS